MRMHFERYPSMQDKQFINNQIKAFNRRVSPAHQTSILSGSIVPLCYFVRDDENNIVAGITAETYWWQMFVNDFWVHEDLRGQGWGKKLLNAAEQKAIERECRFAQLTTYSFQARDFYLKMGWKIVGEMTDYPPGESFYWMRKDFVKSDP